MEIQEICGKEKGGKKTFVEFGLLNKYNSQLAFISIENKWNYARIEII